MSAPVCGVDKPTRKALTRYQLTELVGSEMAAFLMCRIGGRKIPRATPIHERNERVRADLERDSYEVVARRYHLSVSQVVRIGKRPSIAEKPKS